MTPANCNTQPCSKLQLPTNAVSVVAIVLVAATLMVVGVALATHIVVAIVVVATAVVITMAVVVVVVVVVMVVVVVVVAMVAATVIVVVLRLVAAVLVARTIATECLPPHRPSRLQTATGTRRCADVGAPHGSGARHLYSTH